jgi:hypothetical protein
LEKMRLSPKVLPVMGVHSVSLMVVLAERAPLRLEEENVEIGVFGQSVDKIDLYFRYNMGERSEIPVLALAHIVAESIAKLCFVLFRVVEPLHVTVAQRAGVAFVALVRLCKPAEVSRVGHVGSPAIFQRMVIFAMLWIMLCLNRALLRFECGQVEVMPSALLIVVLDRLLQLHLVVPGVTGESRFR